MDAQTLFREGVLALRDKHDVAQARQLLTQSLKLDPNNEMAWLWLSRTTDDPAKKMQCVERALRINPDNTQAVALRDKLRPPAADPPVPMTRREKRLAAEAQAAEAQEKQPAAAPPVPMTRKQRREAQAAAEAQEKQRAPASAAERTITGLAVTPPDPDHSIEALLGVADRRLQAGDTEGAIEQWVRILDTQPDQPVAIQKAVQYLYKLGYKDDARELISRAIHEETTSIPIYLTAIDLARESGEPGKADSLREQVAALPNADEELILKIVDYFVEDRQSMRAIDVLEKALVAHPNSTTLLVRVGELHEETTGDKAQAQVYYERAARGKKGKISKNAEKALSNYLPMLTDRERGSVGLAFREALGFGVIFVLLGWQDAGLDLLRLGPQRWLGVGLSIVGGYLLVTALSSPQQKPLAAWLGGKVPAPEPVAPEPAGAKPGAPKLPDSEEAPIGAPTALPILPGVLRGLFALVGLIVLVGAFLLVFSMSIGLLRHPVPPTIPSINDLLAQ